MAGSAAAARYPTVNDPIANRILNMSLKEPDKANKLTRPKVESIRCEVELTRPTAEAMFKTLAFDEGEETVTITEVLRPAKVGEPHTFFHAGSGTGFCVDHYELDGVTL